jgi:hypothetical protein
VSERIERGWTSAHHKRRPAGAQIIGRGLDDTRKLRSEPHLELLRKWHGCRPFDQQEDRAAGGVTYATVGPYGFRKVGHLLAFRLGADCIESH